MVVVSDHQSVRMGIVSLIVYLALLCGVFAEDTSVKLKIEEGAVVPDVIDIAPSNLLQVTYPSGVKAELGNELTPTQVKEQPSLQWDVEDNAIYTLLLTDPDAPAQFKEFRHWLVVNIPGNKISEGKIVFDYIGSGPPKGTGLHRYVFLVFKQSNPIETDTYVPNNSRDGRPKTKARDLIKEYNLGVPVAGNFFRAQFDDYVPVLHAQLGGAPKIN